MLHFVERCVLNCGLVFWQFIDDPQHSLFINIFAQDTTLITGELNILLKNNDMLDSNLSVSEQLFSLDILIP